MKYIALLLFFSITLFACSKDEEETNNKGTVEYEVNASQSGLFVTYMSEGTSYQRDISSSNWSESFTASSGDIVYLQALAKNIDVDLEVRIYWKGNVFKSDDTSGDFPQLVVQGNLD
jgi:hypothetical protein